MARIALRLHVRAGVKSGATTTVGEGDAVFTPGVPLESLPLPRGYLAGVICAC